MGRTGLNNFSFSPRRLETHPGKSRYYPVESLHMKLNKFCSAILFASIGCAFITPSVFAADVGSDIYIGGALSLRTNPNLGGKIDSALSSQGFSSATSAGNSSGNPSLRLGYRINPNLAVEASYDRTGNLNLQSAISAPTSDTATGSWSSRGLGLHVLGIQPIDTKWSVYGRLGVEQWRTSLNLASNAGGATSVATQSSNMTLALGAGTAYALTSNLDATGEFIHYNNVGNATSTGRVGLNTFNVGLRYHFM